MTYPDRVIAFLQAIWLWLGAQGPTVQPLTVLVLAWAVPLILRRYLPNQWEAAADLATSKAERLLGRTLALRFRVAVQTLPSLAVAASMAVLLEGGDLFELLRLEVYALFAPLAHVAMKRYRGGTDTRPTVKGKGSAVLLLLLVLPGCGGSMVEAQREAIATRYGDQPGSVGYAPSQRCQDIDSGRTVWGAVAVGGTILTGASGLAAFPIQSLPPDAQGPATYTAAGVGIAAAVVTAVAVSDEQDYSEAWVRECTP